MLIAGVGEETLNIKKTFKIHSTFGRHKVPKKSIIWGKESSCLGSIPLSFFKITRASNGNSITIPFQKQKFHCR